MIQRRADEQHPRFAFLGNRGSYEGEEYDEQTGERNHEPGGCNHIDRLLGEDCESNDRGRQFMG
jgi:hypothetical protein